MLKFTRRLRNTQGIIIGLLIMTFFLHSSSRAGDWLKSTPLETKLAEISQSSHRPFFVDVDETLGHMNEATGVWTLYDGAPRFLHQASSRYSVILLTGNIKKNIDGLLAQYPGIKENISLIITSEEYAVTYAKLVLAIQPHYALLENPTFDEWLQLIYKAYLRDPGYYVGPGIAHETKAHQNNYEDWTVHIYYPFISPNKSKIVLHFNGIWLDDAFVNPVARKRFESFFETGRAVSTGRRGGTTSSDGPDYEHLLQQVDAQNLILSGILSRCSEELSNVQINTHDP